MGQGNPIFVSMICYIIDSASFVRCGLEIMNTWMVFPFPFRSIVIDSITLYQNKDNLLFPSQDPESWTLICLSQSSSLSVFSVAPSSQPKNGHKQNYNYKHATILQQVGLNKASSLMKYTCFYTQHNSTDL